MRLRDRTDRIERIKWKYQVARDYAYRIFERYERMYGYLSAERAMLKLMEIRDRWHWGSTHHLNMPWSRKISGIRYQYASTPFCPVGKVGDIGNSMLYYAKCEFCGNSLIIKKGTVIYPLPKAPIDMRDLWCPAFRGMETECTDPLCNEVSEFLRGKHSLISKARRVNLAVRRPKDIANLPKDDQYVLGLAALLDLEARYKQKLNKAHSLKSSR